MSNSTYSELWKEVQNALEELIQVDSTLQGAKPQKDRKKAHRAVSDLYVRYIIISNKLNECYDQIVQPQKRVLIKKLLDSTLGRVLELKHELVEIDLSEFNYCDDVLLKYGVTPQEAEIVIPNYYRRERVDVINERRSFIEGVLRNLGTLEERNVSKVMSEFEAIRLIQAHERARQGRVRFLFMKEIRQMKERSTIKSDSEEPDLQVANSAAVRIQKIWRGYSTRRRIKKRRIDEMLLIGTDF